MDMIESVINVLGEYSKLCLIDKARKGCTHSLNCLHKKMRLGELSAEEHAAIKNDWAASVGLLKGETT